MRFQTAAAFDRDFKGLSSRHQKKFREKTFPLLHDCATRAMEGEANPWHDSLRVKKVRGGGDIWEMTWSWRDPDGRATWEWIAIEDDLAVRWRRVGTHEIFKKA